MVEKQLKDRIIETALTLFEKYGYHGVTVDRIVAECGASKGGFYHNFKSKDELLYHIHDVFITYVLNKAQEAYVKYKTPTKRLCAIIQSFVRVFHIYKPHITVFNQEAAYLKPEYAEKINAKREQYKQIIFQVLREGIEAKQFRAEVPVEIAGLSIIGMVNWMYKWYKPDGPMSIEQIATAFNDLILHSLLTEEAKRDEDISSFLLSHVGDE
ncbi:TetR/AcrR family transcriptional regulator [Anoxybacillus ayderensis]|uniref:TetR/AcrR family transcriptional regulator n=2 Tax=Anoxybacillus TaxID=150247 RepID=A0A2G5RNZ7_9BACL|nr:MULTISPECIES: TetR/AcrR family transcriptional regulator [Anoxybacillus]AXM88718.1 TetR/AcrR family transcriptional regulator [Anoxybacillus ayderensis G10]KHF27167.1 HTH-type transcriptional repressor KstR2 [Anoxybacillus sp. BCO1]EPZ37234.1 TetR family transcriptional regulator [Anoxybacillus ayderensis]KFZ43010.1 TetR family transcriptional regulator [Anoxybacillus sp. KU2-6(11)]KIP20144.1 HTH-type transcriptional repressor KstR2 [Anoxybacillus ayderensis]